MGRPLRPADSRPATHRGGAGQFAANSRSSSEHASVTSIHAASVMPDVAIPFLSRATDNRETSLFLCKDLLEPLFSFLPAVHCALENSKIPWAVTWLNPMAEFVSNDIINCIHGSLNQTQIQRQAAAS